MELVKYAEVKKPSGLVLSAILKDRRPGIIAVLSSLMVLLISVLILIFRFELLEYGLVFYLDFVFYPALIVLFEYAPAQKLFNCRIFGTLARISFNVYIWHYEMNIICSYANAFLKLGIDFSSRVTEIAVLILNIAVGAASYYVIEIPLNALIKKLQGRMSESGC